MHHVALDFVGGRFEARFFCRDQQRWLTWAAAELRDVRRKVARHFAGTKYRMTMTAEAASR